MCACEPSRDNGHLPICPGSMPSPICWDAERATEESLAVGNWESRTRGGYTVSFKGGMKTGLGYIA